MPAAEADPAAGQEGTPPPWWPKHACTASHLWCKPLESASSARRKSMTPRPGWEYRYVVQSANFLYIFKAEDADESSRSRRPLEAVCFEDLEYTQRALPDEEVRRRADLAFISRILTLSLNPNSNCKPHPILTLRCAAERIWPSSRPLALSCGQWTNHSWRAFGRAAEASSFAPRVPHSNPAGRSTYPFACLPAYLLTCLPAYLLVDWPTYQVADAQSPLAGRSEAFAIAAMFDEPRCTCLVAHGLTSSPTYW